MGIRIGLLAAVMSASFGCDSATSGTKLDMSTPPDLTQVDNGDMTTPPDLLPAAGSKGHVGFSLMSGGVKASSTSYKVIMSLGQSPGANGTAASSSTKNRGGLVGATQGK